MAEDALTKDFDLHNPALAETFYEVIDNIRDNCPVGWSDAHGGYWLVTGYEENHRVLSDAETFSSNTSPPPVVKYPDGPHIPVETDAPDHTVFRQTIIPGFSPRRAADHEPEIRKHAQELLHGIVERGGCDWVMEFAGPLPAKVVLEMIGFPWEDVVMLNQYKEDFFLHVFSEDEAVRNRVLNESRPRFRTYVVEKIDQRRSMDNPPQDALTAMIQGVPGKRQMTDDEIVRACMLLIPAGLDTVAMTLTFMASYLAQNPAARQQLRDQRDLIPAAVEEFLRVSSVVSPARVCTRDVEVGGKQLREGDIVQAMPSSAARDGREFERAKEVRFDAETNRHMAFGVGPHRCLGSNLARLELRVALEEMLEIMPEFELAPGFTPALRPGVVLGIQELRLVVPGGAKAP